MGMGERIASHREDPKDPLRVLIYTIIYLDCSETVHLSFFEGMPLSWT